MAYIFPSAEWLDQLKTEINRSQAYAISGKSWEGDFSFVVKSGGPQQEAARFYLDLWRGKCRDAHIVTAADHKKPEFIVAGSQETYRLIFDKQLDPIKALMTRKLELQGNIGKILRYVKATFDLLDCCTQIDTVYVDGQPG